MFQDSLKSKIAKEMSGESEEYGNDKTLEMAWAAKAYEHCRIHMNLLCAVDPKDLRLTGNDDELYAKFRQWFEKFNLDPVDEDELKSVAAKTKWREFIELFKAEVEDFDYGTLLRIDPKGKYHSNNTILVARVQFLVIEISRNKEGVNSKYREIYKEGEEGTGY